MRMQLDTFIFTHTRRDDMEITVQAIDGHTAWELLRAMPVYKFGIDGIFNYWGMVIACRHCGTPVHDSGVYCSGLCHGLAKYDLER